MQNFRKILAVLVAGLIFFSLAACGAVAEPVLKMGLLEAEIESGQKEHESIVHPERVGEVLGYGQYVYFNNLASALMEINSGKIVALTLDKSSAEYIVARNENMTCSPLWDQGYEEAFSMMTMDTNKEVYDILNNAIVEMKADGTLDSLVENELKAYIGSDPEAKDLPKFEGAKTIKVGVTGDLPPMDFVAANGKAAGFNIALLSEIASRAQVNFELVQIETSARPMALASGKVDAVFWTKSITCVACSESWGEAVEGALVTESYFSDPTCAVLLKTEE